MDSLLANYASSDEEHEEGGNQSKTSASLSKTSSIATQLPPLKSKPSLFSSLPPPKTSTPSSSFSSSSLFSSLPPPKSQQPSQIDQNRPTEPKETKPIFFSLPPPKSQPSNPQRDTASSNPSAKRVVQFTLPLNPSLLKYNGVDDEEEDEDRKPIKDLSNSTFSKALSSMLPAPKNSLCLAPTVASRRAVVDSNVSSSIPESIEVKQESSHLDGGDQETGNFGDYGSYPVEQGVSGNENYGSYDGNWAANESYNSSYGTSYGSDSCGDYGSYASNWSEGAAAVDAPVIPERIFGKRGRNEVPTEIVEVNQAELVKNRPRQDQAKLTGMAFGPAYQPVSTSKGKPSKLHKRKHQIGTLYYDMRQKEMELAERRAKGFLTKAETQAKYGW